MRTKTKLSTKTHLEIESRVYQKNSQDEII